MRKHIRAFVARTLSLAGAGLASVHCSPLRPATFPAASPEVVGRQLSRADAVADIDTLVSTMERVHPDLYAVRARDSFFAARQQLVANLPDSLSRSDFWIRLSPLVATLGDGHTSIGYPGEEIVRMLQRGTPIFPPQLAFDDQRTLVVSVPFGARGLSVNDRIVTLNGRNADSLFGVFLGEFSGESVRFRLEKAVNSFRDLLVLHGIVSPYSLDVVGTDGAHRTVSFDGISLDSLLVLARRGRAATPNASPNISYRALGARIGYLNFRSMGGDVGAFRSVAADMFRRVAADSDTTLIIDVRTNGGGDSRMGEEVLRYLTTAAYRGSGAKEWRMSREFRNQLKSLVKPPLGWLPVWYFHPVGRQLFRGPHGTIVNLVFEPETHPRAEPFFSGRTCVLIGDGTFSSAVDFADAVKTYHLATLVGEETGGRPTGFGEVYFFRLPHSQLGVSVSSARYVRASGDTTDHRGVVPDIATTVTSADRSALRDVALERAKSCPALR